MTRAKDADDALRCVALIVYTTRWLREHDPCAPGECEFAVIFGRAGTESAGPTYVLDEIGLAELIASIGAPVVSIKSAHGENVEHLKHLVEFSTAQQDSGTVH
jgi:hypothetical protein